MDQLENPMLLCHSLEVDETGRITDYKLRQSDAKRQTIEAFRSLNYRTLAFGDSYNDIAMLKAADKGILFCPPSNIAAEFPAFPATYTIPELKILIKNHL
jgi:phosphoserine/homoserine phosphotransferase